MNEVDKLWASVARMREAAEAERIEPGSTLGVWVEAQETALTAMAEFAEQQSTRIIERADAAEKGMNAAVERVDAEVGRLRAANEAARQLMLSVRAETANLKEERLKAGDDLAVRLSDKIQKCLETTMLVRERRWNLRQNVKLVALGFSILFAAFLGGEWMQGHNLGVDIIERCRKHQAVDPDTKTTWCAMSTIEGISAPAPAAR